MSDYTRCLCGKRLIVDRLGGKYCIGCQKNPHDCQCEERNSMTFTRARPRDPDSTERKHFRDASGNRLICHQATSAIVQALERAFGVTPISREDYYDEEADAMGMQPAEGK